MYKGPAAFRAAVEARLRELARTGVHPQAALERVMVRGGASKEREDKPVLDVMFLLVPR